MKKNTIVHCFSLPDSIEKEFFLIHLPLWVASFNYLSKHNNLILYCDKESEKIAINLGLNYNEIHSIAEKNRSVLICLDAMKYFKEQKNYIFVDVDVISNKDFSNLKYDVITQGIEYNNGWNLRNIIDYRKKYIDLKKDYYYNPEDNNLFAYNAGFLGFNHNDIKEEYINNWQLHIDANVKYNEYLQYDHVFGTHVEQVQLYSIIKQYSKSVNVVEVQNLKKEISDYKNIFEVIRHDYFHPHGRYKYDEKIKRDILKYISMYCDHGSIQKINVISNDITVNDIMKLT